VPPALLTTWPAPHPLIRTPFAAATRLRRVITVWLSRHLLYGRPRSCSLVDHEKLLVYP